MTELLQLVTIIMLVFVWLSITRLSERIALQTAGLLGEHLTRMEELTETMREQLEEIESRLENIEESLEGDSETDDE